MHKLSGHHNNPASQYEVSVDFSLQEKGIEILFQVKLEAIHVDEKFCPESYDNWGLWEKDVVEVFLTRHQAGKPYLEFQLSPLNQKFALVISRPREDYAYPQSLLVETDSELLDNHWSTRIFIPFTDIPGEGNELYGNFFSCLGATEKRSYFAKNINTEENADFHRPELFESLGSISC
jgi:hypothetical protein